MSGLSPRWGAGLGRNSGLSPRLRALLALPGLRAATGASPRALALFVALATTPLAAHVGSPDVYLDGKAGPYALSVTVRPPAVIPGVAEVEIRAAQGVDKIYITPTPLTGPGAKFAPTPDLMKRSREDAAFFTGALWMMSSGSWEVRIRAEGTQGQGDMHVPVPNAATRTLAMSAALGWTLSVLMMVLAGGLVAIAGAAAREARLEPGLQPGPPEVRRGRIAMGVASVLVLAMLWGGYTWWGSEARSYDEYLYKPLGLKASYNTGVLRLNFEHRGWFQSAEFDDLVPDHDHLMHLFVVARPGLDRVWHLHPRMTANGVFTHELPAMPAGRYQLFADIVHRSGFPETLVTEIDLPAVAGAALAGDDTAGAAGAASSIVFENASDAFVARRNTPLRFRFAGGEPIELYLGMPGHAAVIKKDLTVFAHVHPTGTVPMAALALAAGQHAGHYMDPSLPRVVAFPYGFPAPGEYRVFVQLKRNGKVETAPFDVVVK